MRAASGRRSLAGEDERRTADCERQRSVLGPGGRGRRRAEEADRRSARAVKASRRAASGRRSLGAGADDGRRTASGAAEKFGSLTALDSFSARLVLSEMREGLGGEERKRRLVEGFSPGSPP